MPSSDSSILVLDASAFYAGIPFLSSSTCCTSPAVLEEVKHIKGSQGALEALISVRNLRVIEPDADSARKAKTLAEKSGDTMSKADLSVLALALQLKGTIVTDDYAIANTAELAGIKVSYVMTRGVRKVGRWVRYCAACKVSYRNGEVCNVCGNKLRKKLRGSVGRQHSR